MYLHIYNQPASASAKQLSDQLVEVVRAAKKSNQNLSYLDVYKATQLTCYKLREEFGGASAQRQLWFALGVLVIMSVAGVVVATLYL